MTYEHYIFTGDPTALAGVYQQAGFIAETKHYNKRLVMVYADYTEENRDRVIAIAEEHGAEYDGGGMYVGPMEAL